MTGIFKMNDMIEAFIVEDGVELKQKLLVLTGTEVIEDLKGNVWHKFDVLKVCGGIEEVRVNSQTFEVFNNFDGLYDVKVRAV